MASLLRIPPPERAQQCFPGFAEPAGASDGPTPRAATALAPCLQTAAPGAGRRVQVWRADQWAQAGGAHEAIGTGFAALDRELPGGGWPQGQLVELLADRPGTGELSLLLPALAAINLGGGSCVWVLPCREAGLAEAASGPYSLPYAPALQAAGIDLGRNIFVQPLTARESGWALEQSLRAGHLGALLGWLPEAGSEDADFRCLRRLHLLAQRHRALVFVLRSGRHACAPSPCALRLRLDQEGGSLQLRVLKRRGRPLLEPVVLNIHPTAWSPRPAAAATRPGEAAAAPAGPTLLQRMRALAAGAPAWAPQAG